MSLLSSDSLLLYLGTEKVQAVQLRGWRRRIAGLQELAVSPGAADVGQGVLETALRLVGTLKPARVRVVLSDRLVRYFCFPWRAELRNETEQHGFARLLFDDIYGADASAAWCLTFSDEAPGRTRLVAAMPRRLLEGLQQGLAEKRVALTSVRPQLVNAVHAMGKALPRLGWLVSQEPGRISIAGWDANGWRWVSSGRMASDTPDLLLARLHQELTLAGVWPPAKDAAPCAVAICAPDWAGQKWPATTSLQLVPWQLPPALAGTTLAGYRHALLGLGS